MRNDRDETRQVGVEKGDEVRRVAARRHDQVPGRQQPSMSAHSGPTLPARALPAAAACAGPRGCAGPGRAAPTTRPRSWEPGSPRRRESTREQRRRHRATTATPARTEHGPTPRGGLGMTHGERRRRAARLNSSSNTAAVSRWVGRLSLRMTMLFRARPSAASASTVRSRSRERWAAASGSLQTLRQRLRHRAGVLARQTCPQQLDAQVDRHVEAGLLRPLLVRARACRNRSSAGGRSRDAGSRGRGIRTP